MNWKQVKLNECCLSIADGDHQPPPKAESGVAFITISNINSFNGLDFSNTMYVPQAYYEKLDDKRKPSKGDILLTVVGSFGIPVYIENDSRFVFQRHIALLRPNKQVIFPCFLYNYMRNKAFMAQADAYAIGAAQRTISLNSLRKFKILLPDIGTQKRIASILSAYDDLIENNNKRIKILEQMAENLYKEWFVRFRFPGYENAEFENGIPKGWKYGNFSNLGTFIRGKNITASQMIEGDVPVISAGIEPSGYHNEHNVTGKSLTISASGANAGYLKYHLTDIWAADCSYCQDDKKIWFMYNVLKFLQPVITNLQVGAAQSHVYPKNINKLCVIIPDNNVIQHYCDIVDSFYEQIKWLKEENDNLIKQRDMLLPRLMSGKLEV